ncbi:hypothetical protein ABZP36_015150 [Zizania latifolia]
MLAAPRRWAVAEEIFVFPCCGLLVGSVHGAQQEAKRKEGPACLPACLVNNEETSTEASSRAFRKILLLEGKTSSVLLSPFSFLLSVSKVIQATVVLVLVHGTTFPVAVAKLPFRSTQERTM